MAEHRNGTVASEQFVIDYVNEEVSTNISTDIENHNANTSAHSDIRTAIESINTTLEYLGGVTSPVQTQIDSKVNKPGSNDNAGYVLESNGDGTTSWVYRPRIYIGSEDLPDGYAIKLDPNGRYVYDYAKAGGYTGTEEEFIKTLVYDAEAVDNELSTKIVEAEKSSYNFLESYGLVGREALNITSLDKYDRIYGMLTTNGSWGNINEKYQFVLVPITNIGSTLSITAKTDHFIHIAGLRSFNSVMNGEVADFSEADGWTTRFAVAKGTTKNYYIPDDVKYLYITVIYNSTDVTPVNFDLNIPYGKGRIDVLEEKVAKLTGDDVGSATSSNINWIALGDSITEGYYSIIGENVEDAESHKDNSMSYCAWVARAKGFKLDNKGVGGSGWLKRGTTAAPKLNAREQIDAVNDDGSYVLDFTKYDLCTIMWGVNDWKGSQNFGAFEDGINPETESVYGNMRYTIETILTRNPNIKLIIITPVNCRQDTSARPSSADINWGIGFTFGDKTLEDYYTAIKTVCEYYGIEMIDMLHNSVINRINATTLLPDKVHPSIEAHKQMGLDLAGKILYGC